MLIEASQTLNPGPSWWAEPLAFFGTLESLVAGAQYSWDGTKRFKKGDPSFLFFQFTIAGWGSFARDGEPPQRVAPGMGFFGLVPSQHRYYLAEDSPGWTFGWVNIYHPYLIERISKHTALTGPVVSFAPNSAFIASTLRLIAHTYNKDVPDRFEGELALFEFLVAYERLAHELSHPSSERDRVLGAVQKSVLTDPTRPLTVDALAAEFGMSRSNFSHFFRTRTGLTPAAVVTQTRVREAARLLLQSDASLKQIADACGFANANHFNRTFRRLQHASPGAYRKLKP